MGRELDLSGLTDTEAEHVLQVVQRDMKLRKSEEERLSDLKQELLEEGTRCLLLSRQSCFNRRCCIRCCSPFTFLLNPKRQCSECGYNVCKACRVYSKRGKTWLCSNCQKSRLLKTQSLEWFYTNVKKRFKRFGSAKVLKTFYRKHLAEHGALSELTDGSTYEDSICNEGSVCGSDSTFYRQTEEHSMAETLTVALRVAEEAIDEAISNADFSNASQNKQNEALYLREHRGELVEELAKTIVQKIINRRKTLAEMRAEYDQDWLLEDNTDLDHHHHQSACVKDSRSLKPKPGLWRSQSAFSLLDNDPPHLRQHSPQALQKEGGGSAVSTWKSVDRLDNAVLKSPDGNWIALQSAQLSRPSLLTQRKSLVYSALERESGVVSAYEGLDSDNETRPQPDSSWGAALQEIHRKMTQSGSNDRISAPLVGRRGSRDNMFSDSEGNWKAKVPAEIRRPSASRRTSIIDMNFNLAGAGDREEDSEEDAGREVAKVRRSRKKRKSRKEAAACVLDRIKKDERSPPSSDAVTPDTLTSGGTTPEPVDLEDDITPQGANQVDRELTTPTLQQEDNDDIDVLQSQEKTVGSEGDGTTWRIEIDLDEGKTEDEEEDNEEEEELKDRLYRLVAQSRISYFSSTDDELDGVGRRAGEGDGHIEEEGKEEKTDGLTYKLCQLEKEVGASQFSSTEDELDRVGVEARDEEKKTGEGEKEEEVKEKEEEDGESEELAVKVCRLAKQVNANQFSSTEDELDRAGRSEDGEEAMGEGARWTLQAERDVHATQLRNLAGLVGSPRRFTSTQDQLNRVGENEGRETEDGGGGEGEWEEAVGKARDRRESLEDLDVKMFDLRDDRDESVSDENVPDGRWTVDIRQGKTEERIDRTEEERLTEDGGMEKGRIGVEKVSKETEEWRKAEFETVVEAERTEEMISSQETKVQQGTQSEGKWPDENEQEERQEEEKAKDSPWKWELAAAEESCDEDEFNRIISSMLLMTLEDMQGETLKDKAPDNGRIRIEKREPEEVKKKSGFEVDTHSAKASQEAGCENEFEMCGDDVKTESSVKATPGENASRQKESKDGNRLQEKDSDSHEKINLSKESLFAVTIKETIEAKGTIQGQGLDKDKQEDMMMGHTADGSEETDGRHEDTKEEEKTEATEQSDTSSLQESFLSPAEIQMSSDMEIYTTIHFLSTLLEQRYSAVSLRSITTEVLKVLNATEELLQGVEGGEHTQLSNTSLPPNTQHKKLDQQFSRLEENVYVAAGTVYGLEAELGDLEDCARGICSATSDLELCFLEEQVASAAAKVQQSELQICDISARIAALRNAGLNVDTQSRLTKTRTVPIMPVTLDSSRQLRRRLPAPPVKGDKEI